MKNHRLVIIVDALDECNFPGDRSQVKSLISSLTRFPTCIRLIMTSRPTKSIDSIFQSNLQSSSTLDFIDLSDAHFQSDEDMTHIWNEKLQSVRYHMADDNWPGNEKFQQLVKASHYLPQFVETACTLFNTMDDPDALVESLVSPSPTLDPLDKMYSIALDSIYVHDQFEGDLGKFLGLHKKIIGALVVAQVPLPKESLAELLNLRGNWRKALKILSPLLFESKGESEYGGQECLRFVHPSFARFVSEADSKCQDQYRIDVESSHCLLAQATLEAMLKDLHRDICKIGGNSDYDQLRRSELVKNLSIGFQYSCQYFHRHLQGSGRAGRDLIPLVQAFLQTQLLHWLEVSSVTGTVRSTISALQTLREWLQVRYQSNTEYFSPDNSIRFSVPKHHQICSISSMMASNLCGNFK